MKKREKWDGQDLKKMYNRKMMINNGEKEYKQVWGTEVLKRRPEINI